MAFASLTPPGEIFAQDVDPTAPEPAATPAAPAKTDSATKDEGGQSVLMFIFESLGWRYTIAFLAISFTLVALCVMNILGAKRDNIIPVGLVQNFEQYLNEKRYQEAYELTKADESFLGQMLSAGLAKLSAGYAQAIEAMQEVGEDETMKIEHRLSYVALLASVAPMVGLLGTVDGMTLAFMKIAQSGGGSPDPVALAKDISTALVTTVFGLVLAIPALILYGILKNRFQRLTLEVGIIAEQLMSRFQNVGQKKQAES
ncbi:MAG: MotA/TolQ/ExbB proton channel family protein [Pirellulales bacterium]|nr:MotA/TolQ/ExbB proton channel family protein [Pirellulales bacterium]